MNDRPNLSDKEHILRLMKREMRAMREKFDARNEPCPDSETLVDYEAGLLSPERADAVNEHIVMCHSCYLDLLALMGPKKVGAIFENDAELNRPAVARVETTERG